MYSWEVWHRFGFFSIHLMSQHYVTMGKYIMLVGWDRPLQYFFGTVWDPCKGDAHEGMLFSTLHLPGGGVQTVEELARLLRLYLELPSEVRNALIEDQAQNRGNAVRTWEFKET